MANKKCLRLPGARFAATSRIFIDYYTPPWLRLRQRRGQRRGHRCSILIDAFWLVRLDSLSAAD